MNTKVIAIAAVAILVIAGLGVVIVSGEDKKDNGGEVTDPYTDITAISRVNTDGSGIYLRADANPDDFYEKVDGKIVFNKDAMGGTVWGTPGLATIQHVQMKAIADELGLKFLKLTSENNKNKQKDTMYYQDQIFNMDAAVRAINSDLKIDGGILWETQYSMIADQKEFQQFLLTNDLFPGHSCCIVIGDTDFIKAHPDVTVAYLSAYIKGVNYLLDALKDPASDKYAKVIEVCKKYIPELKDHQIKQALTHVVYKYSDDNVTADLSNLIKDVAAYEENLEETGNITKPIKDHGFKDSTEFAEAFVDNSYLDKVLKGEAKKLDSKTVVKVAAIRGDIHQIGLQLAYELGFFEEMNLDVKILPLANGPAVAMDLMSGQSQFGYIGCPPAISNVINMNGVHA